MIESKGYPDKELITNIFPNTQRINCGPIAVIECFQRIPCNPCVTACGRNAIKMSEDINDIPEIDEAVCNGCGLCISICPGLAIMVLDGSYGESEVLFKIPYEFLPLPNTGDFVQGLDRKGEYLADVRVIKVINSKSQDKTPILHVAVDRKHIYDFRNIRLGV